MTQITLGSKDSMWTGNHRELLVTAFIRQEKDDTNIPKEIQSMIFKYYPKFENIEFLRYSRYYCNTPYDEGHFLQTAAVNSTLQCSRIFASNKGFNKDVHLWKLRYLNSKSKRGNNGLCSFGYIGIATNVSSIQRNKRSKYQMTSPNLGYSYFWDKHNNVIMGYLNGKKIDYILPFDDEITTWFDNDEIIVSLDCNQWKLSFYLNEKHFIGTIKLTPNLKYYPVVQFYSSDDQYQVAEFV